MSSTFWRIACLLILSVFVGCGSGSKSDSGDDPNSNEPIHREADLSQLAAYESPLDTARVEIAPAKGWRRLDRDSRYLIRFSASKARNNPLPMAQFFGEPESFETNELTVEQLPKYVELINKELEEQNRAKSLRPSDEPVGMVIGDRPCVRYVIQAILRIGARQIPIDKQVLVTTVNGRRYTLVLQVARGQIPNYRDASYAMFAGMKFSAGPGPPNPEKSPEPPIESEGT